MKVILNNGGDGFIVFDIQAENRETLIYTIDFYKTDIKQEQYFLKSFDEIKIKIKPCKSKELANHKLEHLFTFKENEFINLFKSLNHNRVVDLIQENI